MCSVFLQFQAKCILTSRASITSFSSADHVIFVGMMMWSAVLAHHNRPCRVCCRNMTTCKSWYICKAYPCRGIWQKQAFWQAFGPWGACSLYIYCISYRTCWPLTCLVQHLYNDPMATTQFNNYQFESILPNILCLRSLIGISYLAYLKAKLVCC